MGTCHQLGQTASWLKPGLLLLIQLSGPGSEFSVQGGIQVEAAHFLAGCGSPRRGLECINIA